MSLLLFYGTAVRLCRDCGVVRAVWDVASLTFKQWWMSVVERASDEEITRVAMICNYIWAGHNKIVFENHPSSLVTVICQAGVTISH